MPSPLLNAPPPDASATLRGMVNTGTQTFAGNKTFTGTLSVGADLTITGGLIPNTHAAYDVGLSGQRWNFVYGIYGSFSGAVVSPYIDFTGADLYKLGHNGSYYTFTTTPVSSDSYFRSTEINNSFYAAGNGYVAAPTNVRIRSEAADGASAISLLVNTLNAWSNATAKLQSWQTNSVEKAYLLANGGLSLGHDIGVPAGNYYRVGGVSGDAIMGGNGTTEVYVGTSATRDLKLYAGSGTPRLTFDQSTGGATFSNTVTLNDDLVLSQGNIVWTGGVNGGGIFTSGAGTTCILAGSAGVINVTTSGISPNTGGISVGLSGSRYTDLYLSSLAYLGKIATGSLPAAGAGNEGAIVYDDTTNTFKGSNGSAWNEFASSTWQTALDLDFTAEGSQTLSSDTTYTIGGKTWTKRNSANETSAATIDSNGLNLRPVQTARWWATTFTAPCITIPITSLIPDFVDDTRLRITVYSTGNFAAQYDSIAVGLWANGAAQNYATMKSAFVYRSGSVRANASNGNTHELESVSGSCDVFQFSLPAGISGGGFGTNMGTWSSGFPAQTAMSPAAQNHVSLNLASLGGGFGKNNGNFSFIELVIAAGRDGSATAFVGTIKRIKVEYRY